MFAVIYQFEVKKHKDAEFRNAWAALTQLIYEYEGSLGSRLHQDNNHSYIAYALWPDKETWNRSGDHLPDRAHEVRARMREACVTIETLYELDCKMDLLQSKPFDNSI